MENMKNKRIVYGLGILIASALVMLLIPAFASAEEYGYNYSFGTFGNGAENSNFYYNNSDDNGFNSTGYSSFGNDGGNRANTASNTSDNNANTTSGNDYRNNSSEAYNEDQGANIRSYLAASAFSAGRGGFMPSSIVQWILFAIMVLVIVILARKVFGADRNYHSTPLKHD